MQRLRVRAKALQHDYEIKISRGILDNIGEESRACLGGHTRRIAIISNQKVFDLYGRRTVRSLSASDFLVCRWLIGDGERFKFLGPAEQTLAFLGKSGLERTDAVLALGGGVVGDLAGFVASVYLRGIAFVQVPTTLLAQIDSSVGGKTGVNLSLGKNLVGSFHQPRAVLIDIETLTSLPARELVAGWCEVCQTRSCRQPQALQANNRLPKPLISSPSELVSSQTRRAHCFSLCFQGSDCSGRRTRSCGAHGSSFPTRLKLRPHCGPCTGSDNALPALSPRGSGRAWSAGCRGTLKKSGLARRIGVRIFARGSSFMWTIAQGQ